jgi:hypothetical protein
MVRRITLAAAAVVLVGMAVGFWAGGPVTDVVQPGPVATAPATPAGIAVAPAASAAGPTAPGAVVGAPAPARAASGESPAGAAGLDRWDTTSVDTGDWRDRVAAQFGRRAAAALPLDAGALHTHLAAGEPPERETRVIVADVALAPAPGGGALQGWDGGEFWFGPIGLIRVREASP